MPKKRYSAEQIVTKLRQIDVLMAQGRTAAQAFKEAEISEQSYYWCATSMAGSRSNRPSASRSLSGRTAG